MKLWDKLGSLIEVGRPTTPPFDFGFVSFPKSGRTWIRMFINYYYFLKYPLSVTRRNAKRYARADAATYIPEIHFTHGGSTGLDSRNNPTTVAKEIAGLAGSGLVFLFRDPRDIIISYYHHLTNREELSGRRNRSIAFDEMLRDQRLGIRGIVEFTNEWYAARPRFDSFHLFAYGAIRSDPRSEFRVLTAVFEGPEAFNQTAFDEAVERTSLQSMKENEARGLHSDYVLKPAGTKEGAKVRSGKAGGYTAAMSASQLKFCRGVLEDLHPDLRRLLS